MDGCDSKPEFCFPQPISWSAPFHLLHGNITFDPLVMCISSSLHGQAVWCHTSQRHQSFFFLASSKPLDMYISFSFLGHLWLSIQKSELMFDDRWRKIVAIIPLELISPPVQHAHGSNISHAFRMASLRCETRLLAIFYGGLDDQHPFGTIPTSTMYDSLPMLS